MKDILMQPLDRDLRNRLERVVIAARDEAEAGAGAALEHLGVGNPTPYAHLSELERDLRRRLRAHGRSLGDERQAKGEQETLRLMEEVAYQHWHRMLFARFLAENNLLMYPDPDESVAVSLEECEELAAGQGAKNGWELAARYAARMLPQIFRPDSPVFELELPPEHQQTLERLVTDLPPEVFTASDSLGWVYQFWQSKKKDEVNASEVKIGARELPAVTQLFTEPYMVSFLLDNSLGAWWAARRLTEEDLTTAESEEELRQKASLPGVPLEYLRFVKEEGEGRWTPAAGTFDGWPEHLSELKTLDPCCGSGHFLVAALGMLVPMRMESEGLTPREAVDAVLCENIHGLELDQRCVALAAFALALKAWAYPSAGGYRSLPELNIACSGLSVSMANEEWKQLGLGKRNLTMALDWMYDTFTNAPVLGSLLNPAKSDAAKLVQWDVLSTALEQALIQEQSNEQQESAIVAQGLAKATTLLTRQYHWVITNVPYLARGKQNERLRDFCQIHYSAAKEDLATVFLDRCLELCIEGGNSSIVLPQNWLFQTGYKDFREKLLLNDTWHLIARLGPGAFNTISGEVVKAILISLSRVNTPEHHGGLFGEAHDNNMIRGLDVSAAPKATEKAVGLLTANIKSVTQAEQLENPDARIVLEKISQGARLERYGKSVQGIKTGDDGRVRRNFCEISLPNNNWVFYQSTFAKTCFFGGLNYIIYWGDDGNGLARRQGKRAWGTKGLAVSQMASLPSALYLGEKYDSNMTSIVPLNHQFLDPLLAYGLSSHVSSEVRKIDSSLKPTNSSFEKIPFDLDHWTKIAKEKYPNGFPNLFSDDPTQWIFHGHPCGSVIWDEDEKWTAYGPFRRDDTVLQVAVARLLGYSWPAELDPDMELADEQREWVESCGELLPFADEDGIVCIPPVRGETSAADRLLNLLAAAYGEEWSNATLAELLKQADHTGKTLEIWLRDKFFSQHYKLFGHRPFIWHIWDGLHDGFAALVNYHKLDTKLLETLIYTYLGDWISRQKQDIGNGVDGAQDKLAAADALKKKLELILEGEEPYDIFVRWRPLTEQPIGWDPDLNDGVRLNIRPFMSVPDVGKKGAGVLRGKPNIHWKKDRGKDVETAPWYPLFGGDRINDHHLSLVEKRPARKDIK